MLPCYHVTILLNLLNMCWCAWKSKWRKTFLSYLPRHKGLMCWHENQENTRNATSYGDVGRESPTVIWTSLCHPISNDAWRGSDLKNPKFEGYKENFPKKRKTFKWIPPYHMSHSHIILNSPLSLIQIPPMPLSFQDLISLGVVSVVGLPPKTLPMAQASWNMVLNAADSVSLRPLIWKYIVE